MSIKRRLYLSFAVGSVASLIFYLIEFEDRYFVVSWCREKEWLGCSFLLPPHAFTGLVGGVVALVTFELVSLHYRIKRFAMESAKNKKHRAE